MQYGIKDSDGNYLVVDKIYSVSIAILIGTDEKTYNFIGKYNENTEKNSLGLKWCSFSIIYGHEKISNTNLNFTIAESLILSLFLKGVVRYCHDGDMYQWKLTITKLN